MHGMTRAMAMAVDLGEDNIRCMYCPWMDCFRTAEITVKPFLIRLPPTGP